MEDTAAVFRLFPACPDEPVAIIIARLSPESGNTKPRKQKHEEVEEKKFAKDVKKDQGKPKNGIHVIKRSGPSTFDQCKLQTVPLQYWICPSFKRCDLGFS